MPPRPRRHPLAGVRRSLAAAVVAVVVAAGCATSSPPTAHALLDQLEDAGLAACTDRREPVPEVVTCEDDGGDLTVGIVDDALANVRSTAGSAEGPWIVADAFVVITYDGDAERAQAIIDELDEGQLYTVEGGEPEPLEG